MALATIYTPQLAATTAFTVKQIQGEKIAFPDWGHLPLSAHYSDKHLDLILGESQMKPEVFL